MGGPSLDIKSPTPIIGVTCFRDTALLDTHPPRFSVNRAYVQALEAAGAAPLLIPVLAGEGLLRALYQRLDGLLLPGGIDVDPRQYGQEPHPQLGSIDPDLDRVELALARWALADDLPLLAICRGIQVLNVAAGGSLFQDIPSQLPAALDHRTRPNQPRDYHAHTIAIVSGSRLAAAVDPQTMPVNTHHHQAVRDVAPGFVVSAAAPDGVVEGMEHPGKRYVLGVQFHPEEMQHNDPRAAALFASFVAAARGIGE